ncbi:hypothetical protein HaLaN_25404, partial [Haematococcus lacustris]
MTAVQPRQLVKQQQQAVVHEQQCMGSSSSRL